MNTRYPPIQPNPDDDDQSLNPPWGQSQTAPNYPAWPMPPAQGMTGDESRTYTMGDTRAEIQNQTFVDQQGNLIRQRNVTFDNENQRRANLRTLLLNISSLLTGALLTLLALRFFFKLLGADATNAIVGFIYHLSQPFILGFNGIFADYHIGKSGVFETAVLLAVVMYLILAAGVQAIIRVLLAPRHYPQQSTMTTQHLRRW